MLSAVGDLVTNAVRRITLRPTCGAETSEPEQGQRGARRVVQHGVRRKRGKGVRVGVGVVAPRGT
eukprot:7187055-Alexandrium_andersonii.AAC.1